MSMSRTSPYFDESSSTTSSSSSSSSTSGRVYTPKHRTYDRDVNLGVVPPIMKRGRTATAPANSAAAAAGEDRLDFLQNFQRGGVRRTGAEIPPPPVGGAPPPGGPAPPPGPPIPRVPRRNIGAAVGPVLVAAHPFPPANLQQSADEQDEMRFRFVRDHPLGMPGVDNTTYREFVGGAGGEITARLKAYKDLAKTEKGRFALLFAGMVLKTRRLEDMFVNPTRRSAAPSLMGPVAQRDGDLRFDGGGTGPSVPAPGNMQSLRYNAPDVQRVLPGYVAGVGDPAYFNVDPGANLLNDQFQHEEGEARPEYFQRRAVIQNIVENAYWDDEELEFIPDLVGAIEQAFSRVVHDRKSLAGVPDPSYFYRSKPNPVPAGQQAFLPPPLCITRFATLCASFYRLSHQYNPRRQTFENYLTKIEQQIKKDVDMLKHFYYDPNLDRIVDRPGSGRHTG